MIKYRAYAIVNNQYRYGELILHSARKKYFVCGNNEKHKKFVLHRVMERVEE